MPVFGAEDSCCVRRVLGALVALVVCGCATSTGDVPASARPELSPPGTIETSRVIPLAGISLEPYIRIVQSRAELRELLGADQMLDGELDFSRGTVIYVAWYLPDACATRDLDGLFEGNKPSSINVVYSTYRDPDRFCAQIIMPFEQLIVTDHECTSVTLVIDDDILAMWPNN